MIIELGYYELDVDLERTRTANSSLKATNLGCQCDVCQNFTPSISNADPLILDFFDRLGLDPKNASEVMQYGYVENGEMQCGAFFHIVGKIIRSPVLSRNCNDEKINFFKSEAEIILSEKISVYFSNDCYLVPEEFPEPYFQMNLMAHLPWVMDYLPEDQPKKIKKKAAQVLINWLRKRF